MLFILQIIFILQNLTTFAYFTATTTSKGEGANADITTNELGGATITFNSAASEFNLLNYPGGLGVFGAQATIAKTNDGSDDNEYQATFNLKIDYTNKTNTDLTWNLYMVESEYSDLKAAETTTCKLIEKKDDTTGETKFWYSDKATEDATANPAEDQGCKGEAITNYITSTLKGTLLAHGKLNKTTDNGTITKDSLEEVEGSQDHSNLEDRVIDTETTKSKFYYLVINYPNENSNQATLDAGKQITAKLSLDGKPAATLKTAAE